MSKAKADDSPQPTEVDLFLAMPGLDELDDEGLMKLAKKAQPAERAALRKWEAAHRNRERVLSAIDAMEKEK